MTEAYQLEKPSDSSSELVTIQVLVCGTSFAANTALEHEERIITQSFSEPIGVISFRMHGNPDSFISEILLRLQQLIAANTSPKKLKEWREEMLRPSSRSNPGSQD